MFKAARWKNEKNRIKAVFKLQFKATQVPVVEWESMMVTLVPVDIGKPSSKSDKSAIVNGECRWLNPVYETVKLTQDAKTGKIGDKVYQFIVSAIGLSRSGVIGEVKINVAEYAEMLKPTSVSFPLRDLNNGAILHVTIQRIHGDAEERENCENAEISEETTGNRSSAAKQHRKTLMSQSKNSEYEGSGAAKGVTDINSTEEGCITNSKALLKFHSSRNTESDNLSGNIRKSNSFDAISASGSDCSAGQYTPNEYRIKNINSTSFLSPLSNGETHNIDTSTNTSGETNSTLEKQNSDVDVLARQLEVSDIELQTLRKQVVKENRRGQELLMEVNSLKEERDSLKKECEELKAAKRKAADSNNFSSMLHYGTKDPWSMLEETKEELDHQKNLNDNLRLQLQKTQEANAELLFAVRELEELLEQKNMGKHEETVYDNALTNAKDPIIKQELIEMGSYHEEHEQDELDMLVKEQDDVKVAYSQERNYLDVISELELYKKDREDIEMQLEQLALDYEILKQENHDMSSRLEQIQLREQLSMQYECSAHLAVINDLESQVECLEREIEKQEEVYQAKLAVVIQAKVEKEQRAIQVEEKLRKNRWNNANTIDNISEEFLSLSSQLSTKFYADEEMIMRTLEESRELRLEKFHMRELLDKRKEEHLSLKREHQKKCQQLLKLIDFKTTEVDSLLLELKNTREELDNQNKSVQDDQKTLREEMMMIKAELEQLSRENSYLSEQVNLKEKTEIEMEKLEKSIKELENMLQEKNLESYILVKELSRLKEEAHGSVDELKYLRQLKVEQDVTIKTLNFKVQTLATECAELKQCLSDGSEIKSLRKHVILGEDFKNEVDNISSTEKSMEDDNEPLYITDISKKSSEETNGSDFVGCMHAKAKQFYDDDSTNKSKDFKTNGTNVKRNYLQDANAQDNEPNNYQHENHCCTNQSNQNVYAKPEGKEYASITYDRCNISEVLSKMEGLKLENKSMEGELREMQERYSEMSLKFAEVEGERQQLVIRIRTLKNASKN